MALHLRDLSKDRVPTLTPRHVQYAVKYGMAALHVSWDDASINIHTSQTRITLWHAPVAIMLVPKKVLSCKAAAYQWQNLGTSQREE